MKIEVDSVQILELSAIQKQVIQNDINLDIFEEDMKRRLKYILEHKYERCLERLKKEWEPILKQRETSLPTDDEALATLIFSQPDYKDKKTREDEAAQ